MQDAPETLSYSAIGRRIGKSGVHVGRAFRRAPKVGGETLIAIWKASGLKAGRLADFSDKEVLVIARFFEGA